MTVKIIFKGDWHTAYVLFYGPRRLQSKYLNKNTTTSAAITSDSSTIEVDKKSQ